MLPDHNGSLKIKGRRSRVLAYGRQTSVAGTPQKTRRDEQDEETNRPPPRSLPLVNLYDAVKSNHEPGRDKLVTLRI